MGFFFQSLTLTTRSPKFGAEDSAMRQETSVSGIAILNILMFRAEAVLSFSTGICDITF